VLRDQFLLAPLDGSALSALRCRAVRRKPVELSLDLLEL
jgi:hypothetical protein